MKPVEWHYQLSGPAHKPSIIFLHGFMGSCRDWDFACDYWKNARQCLAVDLPGHGHTVVRNEDFYNIEKTATALIGLLDELRIIRSHVVGYSMGGRLALYLVSHYPERFNKVILESASPGLKTEPERRKRRKADEILAGSLEQAGMGNFLKYWYDQPLFRTLESSPEFNVLVKRRIQNDPAGLGLSLRFMGTGSQPPLWSKLKRINHDLLLLVGDNDLKFRKIAEQMKEENSKFLVKVVDNCGHTIHFEKRCQFITEVDRFLNT